MKSIHTAFFIFAQFVLAVALMLVFFSWAPWISCRPLDELPRSPDQVVQIPEDANCFNNNHGKIVFSTRLPRSEDPVGFGVFTAYLISCFLALVVVNYLHRKYSDEK